MIDFLLGILALDLVVIGWFLRRAVVDERAKAEWEAQFARRGGIQRPLDQSISTIDFRE